MVSLTLILSLLFSSLAHGIIVRRKRRSYLEKWLLNVTFLLLCLPPLVLVGYSYLDAGRNVIELFQNKGWTTIISDDLANMVLFMISIVIGLFTGLMGFIVASMDNNIFSDFDFDSSPGGVGFGFGLLIGVVLASIMLGVVESAVSTCIVCFAESPAEFEQNHPSLSLEMRNAWRSSWPTECGNL